MFTTANLILANPDAGQKIDYAYEKVLIKLAKSKATSTAKKGRRK